MSRVSNVVAGLFSGALVGAGVVLLFAPRSGIETREWIRTRVEGILSEGRQAAESRRLELHERLETLKQPGPKA